MMTLAYAFLALTSETNTTGKLWMAAGLVLVMVTWFLFRALTETAALSRALSVGDTERLFELADQRLTRDRLRNPARRARFLVARGLAHLLRGEHAEALAALDEAKPAADLQPLAATFRLAAQLELHPPALASRSSADHTGTSAATDGKDLADVRVHAPRTPWLTWIADGMLAWRDDRLTDAAPLFSRVIDDIRAGSALRAIAHLYAARIADTHGDPAAAARHRASAADLAAPDAAWLRSEPSAPNR
jgi:hypothetical protein